MPNYSSSNTFEINGDDDLAFLHNLCGDQSKKKKFDFVKKLLDLLLPLLRFLRFVLKIKQIKYKSLHIIYVFTVQTNKIRRAYLLSCCSMKCKFSEIL